MNLPTFMLSYKNTQQAKKVVGRGYYQFVGGTLQTSIQLISSHLPQMSIVAIHQDSTLSILLVLLAFCIISLEGVATSKTCCS